MVFNYNEHLKIKHLENRTLYLNLSGGQCPPLVKLFELFDINAKDIVSSGISNGKLGKCHFFVFNSIDTATNVLKKAAVPWNENTIGFLSLNSEIVKIRLNWLPPGFDMDMVKELLSNFGYVININQGKTKEGMLLNTFYASIELNKTIPDTLKINAYNEQFNVLVSVYGRQPCCFICKNNTHLKNECPDRKKKENEGKKHVEEPVIGRSKEQEIGSKEPEIGRSKEVNEKKETVINSPLNI